ncbi:MULTISPECIES: tungstate ABC transporter ATP-binding protein WtpC [Methanobacterium]|uniref:Molybdate/tungstate import ATP-binding protein WtpC n=1 Tax=Methanobacterium veterum TaxID=408577 RepID=A0A9E5A4R0_9EURY|nr:MULTISPECIES: tungstate ABC transporter ATP-binding protein WtpC [Methanobacterium]MCZ3365350.1 tungstate ABC transporter ATP-binding protein WtpC [Methanobacterium veterum]MCZ3373101.1 tungstate ABC transporter ATP-binding protein WtpC [Methanobacterium veterum]
MIRIENLSNDWKEFKINNINLQVEDSEYFIILGPSGSGKTMLLELIAGMWPLDSGKIYMDNKDITTLPPEKRGIGFVYQNYMLFPHKTVFENIAFGLKVRKVRDEEIKTRVKEMMDLLKISHLADRLPRTLSGGEQQRTALARALIIYPKILLMDEPLSALDRKTRDELMQELKEIHRKFDVTLVHVTHNFDEALMLADRIAIMRNGEISQVGTSTEIFRHPADKFVADFVGAENIIEGTAKKDGERLTIIDTGNISIYSTEQKQGHVHITVRPEDIILSTQKVETSARNVFKGSIRGIVDTGALIKLTIDVGEPLVVFLTRQSFLDMELNIGKSVWTYFKATAVHVF